MLELFFCGCHHPADAKRFSHSFISVNAIRERADAFRPKNWVLDSAAFTEINTHGRFRWPVSEYAHQINRWNDDGNLMAAVSQDYMCEDAALAMTGLSVREHQRLTVERYDELLELTPGVVIIPVLQGRTPDDYARHLEMYGDRISPGTWTGVGSVCKRTSVKEIAAVLQRIRSERVDVPLHGFGIKTTALKSSDVADALFSADSMAWSFAARRQGRNQNCWTEGARMVRRINEVVGRTVCEIHPPKFRQRCLWGQHAS